MDFDSLLQLAVSLVLTAAAWYRNQKKTNAKVKNLEIEVHNVLQESGQDEVNRIEANEIAIKSLRAEVEQLKTLIANGKPGNQNGL